MSAPAREDRKVDGFWETRTGWRRLKAALLLEPLPGGARWSAAFGSLLGFTFLLQVVTGILLTTSYAPAVKTAWPSVNFIQHEIPLGWFIRAVHHWGASAMIILVLCHLIQVFVWGAYKRPRELTWMVGVLLLFCVLGLAFTGYLLPWDEKAYWATRVGLGITGTIPLVGETLRTILQGGPDLGNLTLTRFFTLHGFILPMVLTMLATVHMYLFRLHGLTPPWWRSPAQLKALEEPFWPGQAWKDAVLALVVLLVLGVWCWYWPAPLGAEADPSRPYQARPEWYFMFLFRLLRYFEGPYEVVGTFVLPTAFFLVLFFWPLLDRNPRRNPRQRPVAITLLILATGGLLGSTIFAIATDVRLPAATTVAHLEPGKAPPAGPIQRLQIAEVYRANCSACHGQDGSGSPVRAAMPTIPDFRNMAWQMATTDLEIVHQIHDGSEPRMPAFRTKLSQDQILGLAIYLRAFAVKPAAEIQPPSAVAVGPSEPAKKSPPAAPKSNPPAGSELTTPPPGLKEEPTPLPPHQPPLTPLAAGQLFRDFCMACHNADGRGTPLRAAVPEIPDFTSVAWQKSHSDAELQHSILEGKGKFMLPMKSKVGVAGAKELVAYVRKFAQGEQRTAVERPATVAPPKVVVKPTKPEVLPAGPAKVVSPPPKKEESREPQMPPVRGPEIGAVPPPSPTTERVHQAAALFRQYCLPCHGVDGRGMAMRASMPAIPNFTDSAWQQAHDNAQLTAAVQNGKGGLMPAFGGRLQPDEIRDLLAYVRAFGPPAPAATVSGTTEATGAEQRFRRLQQQWNELERQLQKLSSEPDKP